MMLKPELTACAVAMALSAPGIALANDSEEMEKIRAEIQQMKQNYEARIQSLEAKLKQTGDAAGHAEESALRAESAAVQASNRPASANAFNPETSLILQGAYQHKHDIPDHHITGFLPTAGSPSNTHGFSIDASELSLAANIDTWLRGYTNVALVDGAAEVEEAYFQTLGLGQGLTIKGGRFRSGIGYQNELHPHTWDFADNSLMYQVLFGEGALQEGVQVKWLAPTETLVELGAEVGRGARVNHYDKNGTGAVNLFAHVGGDMGVSHAWRAGLSWMHTRIDQRTFTGTDLLNASVAGNLSGKSRIWIADFIYKWAPNGNAVQTNVKLQGEYFHRTEDGHMAGDVLDGVYLSSQSGFYLQAIYQFMPHWRTGVRYDQLYRGENRLNGMDLATAVRELADEDPRRVTAMLDFNPSEFSRFRLQYAHDQSMQGITDNQFTLQYILSMGAHGAHQF